MHIVRLEAQNIQRLSAVAITPAADASAVVLAGANEEGKSSVLAAIEMALAGEKVIPPEPIRRGQEKAYVLVDLGDMVVTRRFTAKGSSLIVENKEGLRYKSPQQLLEGFYNRLSFDPLSFADADAKEQAAILRRLAGLDTSDLDTARKAFFEARTVVNRDVARVKGAIERAEHYPNVTEQQDAGAIVAQLDDAERLSRVVSESANALTRARSTREAADERLRETFSALEFARKALAAAEQRYEAAQAAIQTTEAELQERQREHATALKAVPDTTALREQLAGVQAHNRKFDANQRRAQLATELQQHQAEADRLTKSIDDVDATKATRLAEANFPVEGLGISDAGVTWNGLPFEQASTAIRTRVSVAIGVALNPKLKIMLVRNGNDLDAKNLKLLADAAAAEGAQLWIERIAGGEGLQTIVIEDGAVQGAAPAQVSDEAAPTGQANEAPSTGAAAAPATAPPARRRRQAGSAPGLDLGGES